MNGHMDVRVLNEQSLVDMKCAHFQSSSNDWGKKYHHQAGDQTSDRDK